MFTGIVDHTGEILAISEGYSGKRLKVSTPFPELTLGESIAVDGICLTVAEALPGCCFFEVSPETLQLTIVKNYQIGTRVNLERPLTLNTPLGGHWVTGHVDQFVRLVGRETEGEYLKLTFAEVFPPFQGYLSRKGSVTINGVSLTVNEVIPDGFSVMLIPHTLSRTNLGNLSPGDLVNLELDWMAKLIIQEVRRFLKEKKVVE